MTAAWIAVVVLTAGAPAAPGELAWAQATPPGTATLGVTDRERFVASLADELDDLQRLAQLGLARTEPGPLRSASDQVQRAAQASIARLRNYAGRNRMDLRQLQLALDQIQRARTPAQLPTLHDDLASIEEPPIFEAAYVEGLQAALDGMMALLDTGRETVRDRDLLGIAERLAAELRPIKVPRPRGR
jgi:hypothetical protein